LQLRRRLFHLVAALALTLVALLASHTWAVALAGAATALLIVGEAVRLASPGANARFLQWFQGLLKPNEQRRPTGATYLAVASLLTLALFDVPVAGLALLFVAAGDPAAGVVGSRYGGLRPFLRVPWAPVTRRAKSVEGALAFLAVGLVLAALLKGLGVYPVLWPAAVGAFVAALVEFLPIPVEDNLSVPLVSAFAMSLVWAS
jgi:dolichol kinase